MESCRRKAGARLFPTLTGDRALSSSAMYGMNLAGWPSNPWHEVSLGFFLGRPLEYKYVVRRGAEVSEWQPGENLVVDVPREPAVLYIEDKWLNEVGWCWTADVSYPPHPCISITQLECTMLWSLCILRTFCCALYNVVLLSMCRNARCRCKLHRQACRHHKHHSPLVARQHSRRPLQQTKQHRQQPLLQQIVQPRLRSNPWRLSQRARMQQWQHSAATGAVRTEFKSTHVLLCCTAPKEASVTMLCGTTGTHCDGGMGPLTHPVSMQPWQAVGEAHGEGVEGPADGCGAARDRQEGGARRQTD